GRIDDVIAVGVELHRYVGVAVGERGGGVVRILHHDVDRAGGVGGRLRRDLRRVDEDHVRRGRAAEGERCAVDEAGAVDGDRLAAGRLAGRRHDGGDDEPRRRRGDGHVWRLAVGATGGGGHGGVERQWTDCRGGE